MTNNQPIGPADPTPEQFCSVPFRVRAKIINHTSNGALLDTASRDRSALVRDTAASNPHTPHNALRTLSEACREGTRGLVGANPATPLDVLRRLAEDKSWRVRETVMRNTSTPWICLSRAQRDDPSEHVRARATRTLIMAFRSPVDAPGPDHPWLHYVTDCDLISIDNGRLHVLLPCDLEDLLGPTTGTTTLPIRIDGSISGGPNGKVYDLTDDADVEAMYRLILTEATLRTDLFEMVNAEALTRIWPRLRIPAYVRECWEFRFPEPAG